VAAAGGSEHDAVPTPTPPAVAPVDAGESDQAPPLPPPSVGSRAKWTFDEEAAGAQPSGFEFDRTGGGAMGRWIVQPEADAPSPPNVLAQVDTDDTDDRFPVAVAGQPVLRDAAVSVRCKMVSGSVDQACGLVLRYTDAGNYYVTRANALENNVRLYYVKDGRRHQLASWSGTITGGAWHEYAFEAIGDRLRVFWDGQQVIEKQDATFADAGRVGLWTKADSVTWFDDLQAEAR
jgi:hypothetical protein